MRTEPERGSRATEPVALLNDEMARGESQCLQEAHSGAFRSENSKILDWLLRMGCITRSLRVTTRLCLAGTSVG